MITRNLMALALCAAVAACGGQAPSGETSQEEAGAAPKVIGAALLTQTHVFYQDMVEAMEEAAAEHNFTLRPQYAEFDSRRQNDQLDTFIAQGVDAIIVAPTDSSGIAPVIAEARRQGIPVFTADIAADDAEVVSHIASDNEKGGRLLGEYLIKLLNGEGTIGIIDHPVVTSVQDRTRGFEAALADAPGMKIVQRVPGDGQRDKAFRAAQDLLQAHPDIDAIFGINDDSALGALAAVEAANLQDQIVIVGFDGTPEARATIAAGKSLKADAVQFPAEIGRTTIEVIAKYFRGEEVPRVVPVEVKLIDQASLQAEAAP